MKYTNAMEIAHIIADSGLTQSRVTQLLSCGESTIKSWMRQARADARGEDPPKNARQPADHWVRHVRLLAMVHTAAPALLARVGWDREEFARGIREIPRWPLAFARDAESFFRIIDGADLEE